MQKHYLHMDNIKRSDSDKEYYFFIKYPEVTAEVEGKPIVFSFKASIDYTSNAVEDGELLKDTIRLFKKSKIVETDGYPTDSDSTKYQEVI